MDAKIDVSIIIPTFNRAAMLTAAIASCTTCAEELNIEVIVVDDASTEDIGNVGDIEGVTYVKLPINMGRVGARNRGMEISTGRYIKFLDSDDMLEPGALLQEVNLADSDLCDIVVSGWRNVRVGEDGAEMDLETYQPPAFGNIIDDLLAGKAVPTSAALYRSELVRDQRWSLLRRFDDWDFFLHAAARSRRITTMNQPSYQWRHHAGKRVTNAGMLETAKSFYMVMDRFADYLESTRQMSTSRRKRLAQYMYKELRVLYRFDPESARDRLQIIRTLDSNFKPVDEERSQFIKLLFRFLPITVVLEAYGLIRRRRDFSRIKEETV